MMKRNINSILKEVLKEVKPSDAELKSINESLRKFLAELEKNRKKLKINES